MNMKSKLIVGFILLGVFIGNSGTAAAEPALVYVSPENISLLPGQSVDINITVDPYGNPLAGMQANIEYNPSLIRVNNITEGGLFSQGGLSTFFNNGTVNNTTGMVVNSFDAILGAHNIISIERYIIINITAIGSPGTSYFLLSNVKIASPESLPVEYVLTNGSAVVERVISKITVSPPTKTLSTGGKVFTLSALCQDQVNAPLACGVLDWSSDNTTVATVNSTTGKITTKLVVGMANIFAAKGLISDLMLLTVEAPRLNSITVSPASKTLSIGANQSFSAMCLSQFAAPYIPCTVIWSTSDSNVATFNATIRKAYAIGSGVTYINATSGSITGSSVLTVS